jgi:4-amino-4-deoxy-L-arabinose transferase-like glycosyltransferase
MNRGTRSRVEFWLVALFLTAGVFVRAVLLNRSTVEHFDEGVYASVLWYDSLVGNAYPGREFYAPPLLGFCMQLAAHLPGGSELAPVLPSVLLGSATLLAFWWLARSCFGAAAGLFAIAILSFSDFHVFYSRTALTDVPVLFFLCISVSRGITGIHRRSMRCMAEAGVVCGIAWWTKYTGWLPLAIVGSGSVFWWMLKGRREVSAVRVGMLLFVMTLFAVITFAPWYWQLQSVGGYAAVSANHSGYLSGISGWHQNLAVQLASQFLMDGWMGNLSVGVGLLSAGGFRWWMASDSTWNTSEEQPLRRTFPPRSVLWRFVGAAISLTVISFTVWTPLLLACIAMGGVAGVFLWPVLQRLFVRKQTGDVSPVEPGAVPFNQDELDCGPTIDPTLGACVIVTWFLGMLLTTPLYHPYPRLFMTLMAAIWAGASAGIGWWIESTLSVARRPAPTSPDGQYVLPRRMLLGMLAGALVISVLTGESPFRSTTFSDRNSMRTAAVEVARICVGNLRGDSVPPSADLISDTIHPDDEATVSSGSSAGSPSEQTADDTQTDDGPERKLHRGDSAATAELSAADVEFLQSQRFVIYVYGEPALLYHLNGLGLIALPVGHLNLQEGAEKVPTFFVFGPNAKRSDDFWPSFMKVETSFQPVGDSRFHPSDLVLLDLFSPQWLQSHPESSEQKVEVYRVVNRSVGSSP